MLFYIFFNSLVKNFSLLLAVKEILHPALITARKKA